jgi:exonuclease III
LNQETRVQRVDATEIIENNKKVLSDQEVIYKEASLLDSIRKSNLELNIACHNINEMKSNNHKMELIHEWALDNKIDILGLAETNISKKEGFFIAKDLDKYRSFWSDSNATKKKGSGVGILVEERWERHLGQIDRVNEYMIVANFIFKQLELMVIMIYMPPNNKEEQRRIQRAIIERYIKRTYRTQIVIMGDLNCIVDPELDKSSIIKHSSFKKELIIKWLIGQDFKDSFRIGNPKSKEFS